MLSPGINLLNCLRRAYSKIISRDNLCSLNRRNLFETVQYCRLVCSDASCEGYARYEVSTVNGVSRGTWSVEERIKPSVWRELISVYRVLTSLIHILSGQNVKWFTDNLAVTSPVIVHKGSMKSDLHVIAIDLFKLWLSRSIRLQVKWIQRSQYDRADYLSKVVEKDDWGFSFELLDLIVQKMGRATSFASHHNVKLPTFFLFQILDKHLYFPCRKMC